MTAEEILLKELNDADIYYIDIDSPSRAFGKDDLKVIYKAMQSYADEQNKELREALKEIERLCDNEYPSHELIWRIVYSILNQTDNE